MNDEQFKIEQKINESATTIVYRAFDEILHRTVLLKVLHKHLANDKDMRNRFVREARACAALRSEHIVQVYDLTEIDGAPAIVMEFVEGKSLKDVIALGTNKREDFAKKVATHVLRGIALAHDRGIIHRDIKPGNILVAENGKIKVTDFGLAYVALSPTVTMEGMVLGTPAYMAPEQVRGDEIDVRTDLFALGVTLIEVLSGERIFEGSTYTECMKKVLAFKIADLHRFEPQMSPEFFSFLSKLLDPQKEGRFSTAREALNIVDEKKSSVFIRPIIATRKKLSPTFIVLLLIVLAGVFGWMKFSARTEADIVPLLKPSVVDSAKNSSSESPRNEIKQQPLESIKTPVTETKKIVELSVRKDSGKIFLTSAPWAKVYVNNQLIGETPIAKPMILAAGSHTVMFTNPSFDPIVKTITVESNREMTVTGNFIDHAGYVMCVAAPWAEVFVDEQYKDTTPLTKPIMLSAGKHSVRFKNSAFTDVVKEIVVMAKDTVQLTVSFTK